MQRLTILMLALALPVGAPTPPAPECYRTDGAGDRVELDERACLTVGARTLTVLCAMSLDVPVWHDTGAPCVMG